MWGVAPACLTSLPTLFRNACLGCWMLSIDKKLPSQKTQLLGKQGKGCQQLHPPTLRETTHHHHQQPQPPAAATITTTTTRLEQERGYWSGLGTWLSSFFRSASQRDEGLRQGTAGGENPEKTSVKNVTGLSQSQMLGRYRYTGIPGDSSRDLFFWMVKTWPFQRLLVTSNVWG